MTVSEDVLRIWMREARRNLRRYRDHPHYDDLVAEAYLALWEAISGAGEGEVKNLHGYALRAAWLGAQTFLSSSRNEHRTYNVFKRKATLGTLYLQDVIDQRHAGYAPGRLREPDFAPALIEWLAAEAELAKERPARQALLVLCCLHGLTREEARERLGLSRNYVDTLLRGVSREAIPYAHPGPGQPPNWAARVRNDKGQWT